MQINSADFLLRIRG